MWRHQETGQRRNKTREFIICVHSNEKRMVMGSAMGTPKFSSETESAGSGGFLLSCKKYHIYRQNYTLSSWHCSQIIVYCPPLSFPPLNDGLTAARLSGETGTFGIEAEGLDAGSEHRPTAWRAAGTITSSKSHFLGL